MRSDRGSAALALAAMLAMSDTPKPARTWLDEIDLEEEYELIKQKKSKLSRMKRDEVVRRIEAVRAWK